VSVCEIVFSIEHCKSAMTIQTRVSQPVRYGPLVELANHLGGTDNL
jgi:hypothetical protein